MTVSLTADFIHMNAIGAGDAGWWAGHMRDASQHLSIVNGYFNKFALSRHPRSVLKLYISIFGLTYAFEHHLTNDVSHRILAWIARIGLFARARPPVDYQIMIIVAVRCPRFFPRRYLKVQLKSRQGETLS
jgi:hypothetical protein